jgi:hypothetical protein
MKYTKLAIVVVTAIALAACGHSDPHHMTREQIIQQIDSQHSSGSNR